MCQVIQMNYVYLDNQGLPVTVKSLCEILTGRDRDLVSTRQFYVIIVVTYLHIKFSAQPCYLGIGNKDFCLISKAKITVMHVTN